MNKDKIRVSDFENQRSVDCGPDAELAESQRTETNDIYTINMDALSENHPDLVDLINSITIDSEKIRIFDSESGNPRVVLRRNDGEEIHIHSADDPVQCANKAVDLLGQIENEGIVVLFGFGLGYFAEEIVDRFQKGHILLVYEAAPEVFKLALQVRDISHLLKSERVRIILGEETDNFSVIHDHYHHIINGKFWVIRHEPSIRLNKDAYEALFKRLNEEKNLAHLGVATNIRRGQEFMDACFMNFHSVIRRPGVKSLKDIFKGCTAIIVSAGPSLDRNMHLLKKAKGRSVIIATGGALPALLSSQIKPDFVVEIDPVSDNIEDKFQDNPELKNVPFICLAQYTPELITIYPGPIFINGVEDNIVYQSIMNYCEEKGVIKCFGGSVAHLAFAVAEYIGADVIALLGQDLSYKSDRMHTVGYSDDLDRKLKEGTEKKEDNVLGGIPVRDIFDEDVLSIRQFITFRTSFEKKIKASGKFVVNATEGGLPIAGATTMRFIDFIDTYCIGKMPVDTFSVISELADNAVHCNIDGIINEINLVRKTFVVIKDASKQILKYIKKVKKLREKENKDSPELHHILRKVSALVEKVRHPGLDLLVGYNYGLELYLKKQDIQDIDEIEDQWEMLDKQTERGQIYYSEIVSSINLVNKQLDRVMTALKREKKVDEVMSNASIDKKERSYRAGMIYKEAGIVAQSVRYLEDAAGDQYSGSNLSLAEMYIKQFRYYDARDILRKMADDIACAGEKEQALAAKVKTMTKICEKKIMAWEERKNKMNDFMTIAEEEYGSDLESGFFYFRVKDYERAEKAYLKAIKKMEPGVSNQELSAAYYGLAHTYLALHDQDKAVEALEGALGVDPSNPILYRDLGLIAAENNHIEPAELFLSKAINLAPQEAELYKQLANLYMSLGETDKAAALYESAIQANADISVIQHDLAQAYNHMIDNPTAK